MARKRDDTIKLVLRLPPALHQRLGRAAKRGGQSLNSEMIHRLEQSFSAVRHSKALADALENAKRAAAYQFHEVAFQQLQRIERLLANPHDEEESK